MTTKQQEREALQKIQSIVDGLGTDSYIGWAFEGCFDLAMTNIDLDMACSMKQRAELAEARVEQLSSDKYSLTELVEWDKKELARMEEMHRAGTQKLEAQHQEIKSLRKDLAQAQETIEGLQKLAEEIAEERNKMNDEIIHLKARLFDMLDM